MKPNNLKFNACDKTAFGSEICADAPAPLKSSNEGGTTAAQYSTASQSSNAPRLVIRGENPVHKPENPFAPSNPNSAIIDWLNFTFVYSIGDSSAILTLDEKFKSVFGFGLRSNRNRGHMNYDHSFELGNGFGVFAYGGSSVGGTAFFSISSAGCTATKNWNGVYVLLNELRANITRLDLAHDDFQGIHNIQTALDFLSNGEFNSTHGRPPKPKLIDDFGSGAGKTFYIGSRKNGKLLRVYEKGKQLGDPNSLWVRWELELHNSGYLIPNVAIIYPGLYLAGAYPCLKWISEEQRYFDSIKQAQKISFEVLKKACKNSYGKLIWTMSHILGYSNDEIVNLLSKEGVPSRMNLPVVGGGDAL